MNDPNHIYNWRRVDEFITTSGQPSESEFSIIRDLSVTHIINLGMHDHERALPNEATTVTELGMKYIHIPVKFDNPTEEDFAQFCSIFSEIKNKKVHIHCIANLRVTAFLYRFRRDVLGEDDQIARGTMDSIWRPGGVWATFIGDDQNTSSSHRPPLGESW